MSLELTRDLDLLVRAPLTLSLAAIQDFLARRRGWVERHRSKLEAARAAQPLWTDGSSLPFLGASLLLRLQVGLRKTERLLPGEIVISAPDTGDDVAIKTAVERLYVREAAKRFPAIVDSCLMRPAAKRLIKPELRIRTMKSRWGSCDKAKAVMTLNSRLIRFDTAVIEYVICHELSHLRHRRHDERFYAFLEKLCPGWKEIRNRLAGIYLD